MKCEYEGCENEADSLCEDRNGCAINVCYDHAESMTSFSEYVVSCPNCGCRIGVN